MPQKRVADAWQLLQFNPAQIDAEYHFSSNNGRKSDGPPRAVQLITLRGPTTFADGATAKNCTVSVWSSYADRYSPRGGTDEILGSGQVSKGEWVGSVTVPGEHFSALVGLALSERLKCVSLHSRRGSGRGWLVIHFGVSTRSEI